MRTSESKELSQLTNSTAVLNLKNLKFLQRTCRDTDRSFKFAELDIPLPDCEIYRRYSVNYGMMSLSINRLCPAPRLWGGRPRGRIPQPASIVRLQPGVAARL